MSLKVWLPLNGSASNQGLLGDFTQSTSPSYTSDGKLGKAMTTGAFIMSAEQTASVLNNDAVSFCFWVYIDADTGTTNNRSMFFGTDSMGTNNNRKFSIFNYPSVNDLHLSWMNDTANTTFIGVIMSGALPSRTWTHVAVTYQNPTCKVYLNGVHEYTYTGESNSASFAYQTQLIHNASYRRLNDFRIYDHCLSAKEISEIVKGLVLHWPLTSQFETGMQNKYSGEVAAGKCTSGSFTVTKLSGERGYNYKLTYTGNGNNTWPNCKFGNFSFTAGKKYYYSCKVRCHSRNFSIQLRASRSDNDWVTNMVNILNPDGEWHEYYAYQTVNSTYDRSGSTVNCNPVLEFYSESLSTANKVYSVDFDVKDVQVVESDCYVPFIENSYCNSAAMDCSGFRNNGIITNTPVYYNISPRYFGCINFNGAGYIKNDSFNISCKQETIAFWVKIPETITAQHFLFGTFNSWTGNGIGYWRDTGGKSYSGILKSDAESSYCSLGIPALTSGIWYHIAIVYTGTEAILYVNGAKYSSITYGKNGSIANPVCYLGNSKYNGCPASETDQSCVSDFRIYATALSADAVKQLYDTPISIDNSGNLFAYEFKEV